MSVLSATRDSLQVALGIACMQACEHRDPKPDGEPGFVNLVSVKDAGGKIRHVRCMREGDNFLGRCCAERCPIAAGLVPSLATSLGEGIASKLGVKQQAASLVGRITAALLDSTVPLRITDGDSHKTEAHKPERSP